MNASFHIRGDTPLETAVSDRGAAITLGQYGRGSVTHYIIDPAHAERVAEEFARVARIMRDRGDGLLVFTDVVPIARLAPDDLAAPVRIVRWRGESSESAIEAATRRPVRDFPTDPAA